MVRNDHERLAVRATTLALVGNVLIGVAAAQSGGGTSAGSSICGTPFAQGISQTTQLLLGILILACIAVAAGAHGVSSLKNKPEEVREMKAWRNRAVMGVPGVPIVAWLGVRIAENFGIQIASCVDIVPFL